MPAAGSGAAFDGEGKAGSHAVHRPLPLALLPGEAKARRSMDRLTASITVPCRSTRARAPMAPHQVGGRRSLRHLASSAPAQPRAHSPIVPGSGMAPNS